MKKLYVVFKALYFVGNPVFFQEGLDDDCNENFTNFDWNDDDDEYEDYDDYVQPTRKPLIFKPPSSKTSSLGIYSTSKPSVYSPTLRSGPKYGVYTDNLNSGPPSKPGVYTDNLNSGPPSKPGVYTENLNSGPPAKPADFAFDRFDDNGRIKNTILFCLRPPHRYTFDYPS